MKSARLKTVQHGTLHHVALIPDGNGRWATANQLSTNEGHVHGAQSVEAFLNVCKRYEVAVATVWAFSTENWRREAEEVQGIMYLVQRVLESKRSRFKENGVRVKIIGRRDRIQEHFPSVAKFLTEIEQETKSYGPLTFNLALDYGGRDEIVRAIRKLVARGVRETDVTWETICSALDTEGLPDPDLIIRTSGEQRLSGLMPLQSEYAELHFIQALLPDVTEEVFEQAFIEFANRQRRFGGRVEAAGSRNVKQK
ncbi:MAG: di-trans,poly-cis-decaprenylcistransferase [Acidobacteria bacterium]|nr:MAG: di-trans,poly-cis-decaprenylcistransferase [Acidobacteriota bacterium]